MGRLGDSEFVIQWLWDNPEKGGSEGGVFGKGTPFGSQFLIFLILGVNN